MCRCVQVTALAFIVRLVLQSRCLRVPCMYTLGTLGTLGTLALVQRSSPNGLWVPPPPPPPFIFPLFQQSSVVRNSLDPTWECAKDTFVFPVTLDQVVMRHLVVSVWDSVRLLALPCCLSVTGQAPCGRLRGSDAGSRLVCWPRG
jgi:hypothetical protein